MPDMVLKNIDPVVLSTHIDDQGQLHISYNGTPVDRADDVIVVGIASSPSGGPVRVSIQIIDPAEGSRIRAQHPDDAEQPVPWSRIEQPNGCTSSWSETGREYEVSVSCSTVEGRPVAKDKTVYIKVKPIEDLPDRA